MIEKRYSFPSANRLHNINTLIWIPKDIEYLGIIQIVHGMCEYIERYRDFASFLCGKGFIVCGNDHAGHGESIKNTFGYMGDKDGDTTLLKDVYSVTKYIKKEYKGLPFFLLGHSMGSFVARNYVRFYKDEKIDGLILSGTKGTEPFVDAGIKFSEVMIKLGNGKKISNILNKLSFGLFNVKFRPNRTEYDWISRDTKTVDDYSQDKRCTFIFTNYGFRDLFKTIKSIQSNDWYINYPKGLPTYIFSGGDDPVGNNGKGVYEVYNRLKDSGVEDVNIKIYPDGRHEMLNEINNREVYINILAWLGKQI